MVLINESRLVARLTEHERSDGKKGPLYSSIAEQLGKWATSGVVLFTEPCH